MKKIILSALLVIAATSLLCSYDLPKGWFKAGSDPDKYEMGVEPGGGQNGRNSATIKSDARKIHGFGTLMQTCLPDKYLGKKVRMSGYMRSEDVDKWAGFWFRVDGADSKGSLAFDNMYDRAIKGTTGWKKYEIVLDVPANATRLAYGALLDGTGQIWFENIQFEIVEATLNSTGKMSKDPQNLDFQQ